MRLVEAPANAAGAGAPRVINSAGVQMRHWHVAGNKTISHEMTDNTPYSAMVDSRLTPIYDQFVRLLMRERRFKRDLVAQARIASGHRVLDLGAGTGTLAIMMKQAQPEAHVTGIDGDAEILAIAQEKSLRACAVITFDLGNVSAMTYPQESFDRVVSTLVFSLLSREGKQSALREVYRVLRKGGELHFVDFGAPHTRWGRWVAPLLRRWEPLQDNLDDCLPAMFREAGFEDVRTRARLATVFGTLTTLYGRKAS